jgi:N-methylhydantoinase A
VTEAFEKIGDAMGYDAATAAFDCWRVVNANMSQAVRRTVAGKGIDPKDMVMLAYGGNGPVFAAVQAEDLGIEKVLVPRASPTFSALGTLVANPSIDEERSYISAANKLSVIKLKGLWWELEERAHRFFAAAKLSSEQVSARYQMKMRYPGQNWALTFDVQARRGLHHVEFVDENLGAQAIEAFNKRHMEEFGHIREGEMPEVTGVRLVTTFETPSPSVRAGHTATRVVAQPAERRSANLGRGFQDVGIYRGAELRPGHEIAGPGIIEETFTTIVVYPGWRAHVDDAGDYELVRG